MRIILLIALLLLTFSTPSTAQHEADNWFFGDYNALSFQSGGPILVQGSQLNTREGVAAMSDKTTGALLFYTDGVTVWNNQHQVMKGGTQLRGGGSSTQSALIVPHPTNSMQYYIFTVSESESGENALCYSIVNMALGEVIAKNSPLFSGVSEKLTGTLDCDGTGYWIVTHHVSTSEFYSFHITAQGVSTAPVVSRHTADLTDYRAGYMKISPNRTKIAIASQITTGYLALASFNPLTGEITSYATISAGGNTCPLFTYGIAFSPDNTKLYATGIFSSIFQYEINLPTILAIRTSQSILNITGGALQLGPDGKIYIAQENTRYLGRIDYPNLKGDACQYRQDVIALPRLSMLGLPNCLDYIFNQERQPALQRCTAAIAAIETDSGCIGSALVITDKSANATKRTWTFTGGTPATSTDSIVLVSYPAAGKYLIRLVVENALGPDTAYSTAIVYPNPIARAGSDKTICTGANVRLGGLAAIGERYSWNPTAGLDDPTSSSPMASPTNTTEYIVTVTGEFGCVAYDTVVVSIGKIVATVSGDTTVCPGSSVQLGAQGGAQYLWSPSQGLSDTTAQNPIATPLRTTTYSVIVSSGSCFDTGTVTVTVLPLPVATAGQDQFLCRGNAVLLGDTAQAGNTYQWKPVYGLQSSTIANPTASPDSTTEYILTVIGASGCVATDTVIVTVGKLKAYVSPDTTVCWNTGVNLHASGGASYEWFPKTGLSDPFSADPIATLSVSTTYKVVASSGACVDSATTTIFIDTMSIADAGQERFLCDGDSTEIGAQFVPGNGYLWSPSEGVHTPNSSRTFVSPTRTTIYTVQVTSPTGCTTTDQVTVNVFPKNIHPFSFVNDTVIILPGTSFRNVLHVPSGVSAWSFHLTYDSLIASFEGVESISGALQVQSKQEVNGGLFLRGTGENGDLTLQFKAFLPHTSDTVFAMNLIIDSVQTAQCDRATGKGAKLLLDAYCGKYFRMVSGTGKQYYLTVKDKSIDFGVGLSGNVRLEVFDYVGNSVLVVSNGILEAGEYSAEIDLPVGVYYCRMRAGMYESVGKVLIAR
ncbi:MAG: PKD domain-containing protein [Candidatus Kapaibacterium sp.]